MVSELIDKYVWLIQTFIAAGNRGLSLSELERKWRSRYGTAYPRRSFNNHREAISEVFGVEIVCDRSTNCYYIPFADDVTDQDASHKWMINTFTVGNLLNLGKERLSGRVSVEDIPSGQIYLTPIISAMNEGLCLTIKYRKYTSAETETLNIRPYAVKELQKRWYLVGYCEERKALRVYGLDRIRDIVLTDRKFELPEGFDVDYLFSDSFGIYLPEGKKPVDIELAADETQARFLRDLPLHPSQRETAGHDGKVIFHLRVVPDEALVLELLRFGSRIEVLSPEPLRLRMKEEYEKALKIYEQL